MKIRTDMAPIPLASWDLYAMHLDHLFNSLPEVEQLNRLARNHKWDRVIDFRSSLLVERNVLLITDADLNIEYASGNIYQMNGYRSSELIGKKPNMFQGPDTCQKTTERISRAIQDLLPFEEVIVNYRKDGSKYRCWIKGEPIWNKKGELVNFVAYEREVA